MPLQKPLRSAPADVQTRKPDDKRSKRQRLANFFRPRRQKSLGDSSSSGPAHIPVPVSKENSTKPPRDSKIDDPSKPPKTRSSAEVQPAEDNAANNAGADNADEAQQAQDLDKEDPPKVETLTEEHVHALFSGAPHFLLENYGDTSSSRAIPRVLFPWDEELLRKDVSDTRQLAEPAFSAATLHKHLPVLENALDQFKPYTGYDLEAVELPSMLSAQGVEPGTVGYTYFLELSQSDHLVTDLQQSQTSNEYLEAMRNKELMQHNCERLGIRSVDMALVHDRLVELGDLMEAFRDSPERMTILNNQSSGDLYANLFGKFLTPPRYDSTTDDPTGMKVQIDTLLKILRLRGVWFDFSLVEWRIRLGQILWSDPEAEIDYETHPSWSDRDILLLQITLACELVLRLDAITSMDVDDIKSQIHVSPEDYQGFLKLKTRKTDWDLVLARRFLENILVVKGKDAGPSIPEPKSRGLFSLLGSRTPNEDDPTADIILLPQHQARQIAGLLHFAQTIQWPDTDAIVTELAQKICAPEAVQTPEPVSPHERVLDPNTPSSISVYGTPLASPQSMQDGYFGNLSRPNLNRSNSTSLHIPLSTTLLGQVDKPKRSINVGGWLSRSYLTGLILPGEAMSHFLISTLLENDKVAIATLGDSANLYGGFVYAERVWWSKASVVARVLGCVEGAEECMGWVTFPKLPEDATDGWFAVNSTPLRSEQAPRIAAKKDVVLQDSAIIPDMDDTSLKAEDLRLPLDSLTPPVPLVEFSRWNLTPTTMETPATDITPVLASDAETCVPSITFSALARRSLHTLTLIHDVYFVSSWPCSPPNPSSAPNMPHIRRHSQSLSRTSSKRSSHGYEPLLSHPPTSPSIKPLRMYLPLKEATPEATSPPKLEPLRAHPLHISHKYKLVAVTDVLDPSFVLPFTPRAYVSPMPSAQNSPREEKDDSMARGEEVAVLVLDARASKDLELLARAWCAEKGFHAVVGRVGRTCLACCVREAEGLGINVVIRV